MENLELSQIIAALQRRGYPSVPRSASIPYEILQWLVERQILSSEVLSQYSSDLSAAELGNVLLQYGILRLADLQARNLVHTPAPRRWRQAYGAAHAPFADPARIEPMLEGLNALAARSPIHVRFSNLTGLVRTLRGDLLPEQRADSAQDMLNAGRTFLDRYGVALVGARATLWSPDTYGVIGNVARFQQLDFGELPLYGAKTNFGFDNTGRLTMINSTAFPYSVAEPPNFETGVSWEQAKEIAYEFIRQRYPIEQAAFYFSVNSVAGRTLYPYIKPRGRAELQPEAGVYRPAWAVWVVDEGQISSWEIIVDVETAAILNPAATSITVKAPPLSLCVLADKAAAKAYLANNTVGISGQPVETGGVTDLSAVLDFPIISGAAPLLLSDCSAPDFPQDQLRTGNVYFHLRRAETAFTEIVNAAWPGLNPAPVQIPGTQQPVNVHLLTSDGLVGEYTPVTPSTAPVLKFDIGYAGAAITEPMLDCEVIYHEYAHAMFDRVQPDLFNTFSPEPFPQALNEGLAFYFGVSLSYRSVGDPPDGPGASPVRWSEATYGSEEWVEPGWRDLQRSTSQRQRIDHDFLQVYHLFPQYEATDLDPIGLLNSNEKNVEYHCGMAWARILWDIRRGLGPTVADAVILRALAITGGIQTELETPAEAIVHYDGEHTAGGAAHENALRLIFSQRGVMADTPINAVHTLTWQGQTYLLATTERNNQAGGSGCMFSADNGVNWQALGLGGLDDVVALASVQIVTAAGDPELRIFAAGEHWPTGNGTPGSGAPERAVYQYIVVGNGLAANGAWQALPSPLPTNLDVNSLQVASIPALPGQLPKSFWLFVGAELGLHIYDSSTNLWTPLLPDNRLLALACLAGPRLFASINDAGAVIRMFTPAPGQVPSWQSTSFSINNELFLAIQPDPTTNNLAWVGTLAGSIYQLNPDANPAWQYVGTVNYPVFSLWIEYNAPGQPVIYAGTTNGVMSLGAAQSLNPVTATVSGETPAHTTVLAAQGLGNQIWFGTAQRGLWRYTKSSASSSPWFRQVNGFPRVGQLVDATAPPNICPWSHVFSANLQPGWVATHVLYVGSPSCTSLHLAVDVNRADLQLKLFYVAPDVDLNLPVQKLAGLQRQSLNADWVMATTVSPGFYLLAVASNLIPTYNLTVTLE